MSTGSKILMAITGAAFVALGILCICYPGATLLSASIVIGWIALFSGISTIVTWIKIKNILPTGNLLLSGILQLLIGIVFLNNKLLVAAALPVVFAVWMFIEGIILAIRAFDFKKFHFSSWWVMFVTGILLALAGCVSMKYPFNVAAPVLSYIIGSCIILFGVVDLVALLGLSKIEE